MNTLKTILTISILISTIPSSPLYFTFSGRITKINADESNILSKIGYKKGNIVKYTFMVDYDEPADYVYNGEQLEINIIETNQTETYYKYLMTFLNGNLYPYFESVSFHRRTLNAYDMLGHQFTSFKIQELDDKQEYIIKAGSVDRLKMEIGDSLNCQEMYNRDTTINGTESVLNNSYNSRICLIQIDGQNDIITNKVLVHNFKQKSIKPSIRIVLNNKQIMPRNMMYNLKGSLIRSYMGSKGTYIIFR